jgi:hypothetical protein
VVAADTDAGAAPAPAHTPATVIQEYTKRNLNVAKNLLLYFQWYEKETGWSIAKQIKWAEKYQPLFTPQVKADLNKYLLLL